MKFSKGISNLILLVLVALIGVAGLTFIFSKLQNGNRETACTQDAKICPDGTAVGRTLPNCDFAACPTSQTQNNNDSGATRYIEYSTSNLNSTKNTRRVLFFYASWCPTCRPTDANFKANLEKIPEDTTLIRVNYNDSDTDEMEKLLAEKYGVTYQHTFVQIDRDGNEVVKWNGGDIDELLANIK